MEIKYKYRFDFFRFASEIFMLIMSFILSFVIIDYMNDSKFYLHNIWMMPLLITGWYISSKNSEADDDIESKPVIAQLYKKANSIFIQFFLILIFFFTSNEGNISKWFLIFYNLLLIILLPLEKIIYNRLMDFFYEKPRNIKRVIIIGAGKIGTEFSEIIQKQQLGYEIVGFLDDQKKSELNGNYLGTVSKLHEYITDDPQSIDEVLVALPNTASEKIKTIANIVSKHPIKLRIIPAYHELINSQYSISIFNGFPMITNRHVPLDDIHFRWMKRLFDIVFSSFMLICICSWLFPLIAIGIKVTSNGPVFFIQERWGRKNKKIKCFKFRSMYVSKDQKIGTEYKQATRNDPRITPFGAILRKTSLDELPQFLNVFFGEISCVGPRPHPTPVNLQSKEVIDNYLVRHLIKPGITGWAQVNGYRGEITDVSVMRARVKYDIWYIENWTLLLDIKIIFLTFWKVIVGDEKAF